MTKNIYGDFYDPTKLLSYKDKHIFGVFGSRSLGKSTNLNITWLNDYIKTGKQYIYTRRTVEETKKTAGEAFSDAVSIINDYGKYNIVNFDYEKEHYYLDKGDGNGNQCCGFTIPLATEMQYKSNSAEYANVATLYWDEVIPQDTTKFLGNKENKAYYEFDRLMSLYQTVARRKGEAFRKDCKIVLAANVDTFYSPVLMQLGITRFVNASSRGKFISPKEIDGIPCEWVFQILSAGDVKATSDYMDSPHYRMMALSDKAKDYNFGTGSDNNAFICGCPGGKLVPLCNIAYQGDVMGVYSSRATGKIWISKKPCRTSQVKTLALTPYDLINVKDDSIDVELCSSGKAGHPELIVIHDYYCRNWCLFENGKVKFNIESFFMFV